MTDKPTAAAHPEAALLAARALRRTATEDERAALERATAEILRLKVELARNFYRMGYWLKTVRDDKLYRAHGHATFEAYLAKDVGFSRQHAYTFIRIAEKLPGDFAVELGVEKADALVSYLEATPKEESPAEVAGVLVPVREAGRTGYVPVRKATVKQIRAAATRVRARLGRKRRPKLGAAERAFSRRAEPALRKAGIGMRSDGGGVVFGRVAWARLPDFVRALSSALPPK